MTTEPEAPGATSSELPRRLRHSATAVRHSTASQGSSDAVMPAPAEPHSDSTRRHASGRRSQMLAPALVAPIEVAEDAPGRIEYVVARPPEAAGARTPVLPESSPDTAAARDASWVAVGLVALGLIVIFAVGILLIR